MTTRELLDMLPTPEEGHVIACELEAHLVHRTPISDRTVARLAIIVGAAAMVRRFGRAAGEEKGPPAGDG